MKHSRASFRFTTESFEAFECVIPGHLFRHSRFRFGGGSGAGCADPPRADTARVAGAALDPDRIFRPRSDNGRQRAGALGVVALLGPGRTWSILISVLACRSGRVVRDSLASAALGITGLCLTS